MNERCGCEQMSQGTIIHKTGTCILYHTYLYCILHCICVFWRQPPETFDRCGGLYYVLYVIIVLCIVLCIVYCRSLL
jgi:hypothetical protein